MNSLDFGAVTDEFKRPFVNYYGVSLILYELSTPFLNIHWFLDKTGMTGSTAQLVNGILLLLSFGGSRLVWGTYQSVSMYRDIWTAYTAPGENPVASWLAVSFVVANTILCTLNFFWFSKMIAALRKRFDAPDAKAGRRRDEGRPSYGVTNLQGQYLSSDADVLRKRKHIITSSR